MSKHPTRLRSSKEISGSIWDALDRAGQAGNAADVLTPTALHPDAPSGKRFGKISRVEVGNLATIAQSFGRRGDAVMAMWRDTRRSSDRNNVRPRVDKRPKTG